jgi:RecA/RadA recombinase
MINSYREKPGVVYGDPRTLPGGKFATFYATTHVDFAKQKPDQEKNENDMVTNHYNNHAFRIVKQRTGTSITEGEFSVVASPATGMKPGTVDDWGTVFKYASNFNLAGGAGQGWWIADPDTGEIGKFKSKTLAVDHLKQDAEFNARMKRKIISLHRKSQGLREDGWC